MKSRTGYSRPQLDWICRLDHSSLRTLSPSFRRLVFVEPALPSCGSFDPEVLQVVAECRKLHSVDLSESSL